MIYHDGLINGFEKIVILTTPIVCSLAALLFLVTDVVQKCLNVTNCPQFSRNESLPANECG